MTKHAAVLTFGGIPEHVTVSDDLEKLQAEVAEWVGDGTEEDYEGYIVEVTED